jgi:hypothetical protein
MEAEYIQPPSPYDKKKLAFVVRNVYSAEECKALIDRSEKAGYSEALVNTGPNPENQILARVSLQ